MCIEGNVKSSKIAMLAALSVFDGTKNRGAPNLTSKLAHPRSSMKQILLFVV